MEDFIKQPVSSSANLLCKIYIAHSHTGSGSAYIYSRLFCKWKYNRCSRRNPLVCRSFYRFGRVAWDFPLAALQLMLSIKIRNFGASLGMSICCVVPNIVITGFHSSIGAWFPFTIPYYIMMPQTATYAPRVEPYSPD